MATICKFEECRYINFVLELNSLTFASKLVEEIFTHHLIMVSNKPFLFIKFGSVSFEVFILEIIVELANFFRKIIYVANEELMQIQLIYFPG